MSSADQRRAADSRVYSEAVGRAAESAVAALEALEGVQRRLHPPDLERLRGGIEPLARRAGEARDALEGAAAPAGLEPFHAQLVEGVSRAAEAAALFSEPAHPAGAVTRVLTAFREAALAQESLYPLRFALPALGRWFAEPAWHARLAELDPEPREGASVGVHAAGDPEGRGGFHLYVPERYDAARAWPLVVALHGGFGSGRHFLWTWLREARSRGFLLLAPTSRGTTWSLMGADVDEPALRSMLDYVCERWRVDRERILLAGLSDGGTYSLLAGLAEGAPYTALACVAGVLHPRSAGSLACVAGRRILLVHGRLDWMFPVDLARAAADALRDAGADIAYWEIEDLSHTWPRDEGARILEWFDPSLAPGGTP